MVPKGKTVNAKYYSKVNNKQIKKQKISTEKIYIY